MVALAAYNPTADDGLTTILIQEATGLRPGTADFDDALQDCRVHLLVRVRPCFDQARGTRWSNYLGVALRRFLRRWLRLRRRHGLVDVGDAPDRRDRAVAHRPDRPGRPRSRRPPACRVPFLNSVPDRDTWAARDGALGIAHPAGREPEPAVVAAGRELAERVRRAVADIPDDRDRLVAEAWLAGESLSATGRRIGRHKELVRLIRLRLAPRLRVALAACL